jgi:hypothetical protein
MIVICCIAAASVRSQDLKAMEIDLQHTPVDDKKEVKRKVDAILKIDPLNEVGTRYLTYTYKSKVSYDSTEALFNRLKRENPGNPVPYLLSAKIRYHNISLSDTMRVVELRKALDFDSTNLETLSLLGRSYYTLFTEKNAVYYARESRLHFSRAIRIDSQVFATLKYPVIQASMFLKDPDFVTAYEVADEEPVVDSLNVPGSGWYFPMSSFLRLESDWRTNYAVDVVWRVDDATFVLNWYSNVLRSLREPLLFKKLNNSEYRLTLLGAFDEPIVSRIVRTGNEHTLVYKHKEGSEPQWADELTVYESRRLTQQDWDKFKSLLEATDFWNMPTFNDRMGFDGSWWILEGVDNGKYHVVHRWTPQSDNYQKCGLFLLDLVAPDVPIGKK